jgi:hypothetical protein
MPKKPAPKTHLFVAKAKTKGCYRVAENLYLQVDDKGNKSWLFRYMFDGKPRKMGLGSFSDLSLADASDEAAKCRGQIKQGIDPLAVRQGEKIKAKAAATLAVAKGKTFRQCAETYIEDHKDGWRNAKHIWQWSNSLEKFAYPMFGNLPVQDVDVTLVTEALKPIWKKKNETATRVRGRIESILDWAKVRGYRQGENPARWRGYLENLLPKPSKVHQIQHYPSLPYDQINDFIAALTKEDGLAALALQLVIYTASRSGEVLKAKWSEFDLKQKTWVIPASRTKTKIRDHKIPLSNPAMEILRDLEKKKVGEYVFFGKDLKKPLSDMAMLALIRRLNAVGKNPRWVDGRTKEPIVSHGFRSTFRDWCAEQTNYPREIAEAALSHIVGNKVEAAYLRTDHFDKRKQLMGAWAKYCATPSVQQSGKVVSMRRK